jgi:hypothetical protein
VGDRYSRPRVRGREEVVERLGEELLDGVAEPAPVVVGDPAVGTERHGLAGRAALDHGEVALDLDDEPGVPVGVD